MGKCLMLSSVQSLEKCVLGEARRAAGEAL